MKQKNKTSSKTGNNTKQPNNKISKKIKKNKFSKRHPKIALCIKLFIITTLIALIVGAGIAVAMLYGMWGEDFEITEAELGLNGNSVLYDSEGKVLAELSGDENRKIIKLDDMSTYLPKAYVAIEDERFYEHNGVDFKRTTAAIGTFILHKGSSSYGGSTITQQLVKNMTKANEKSGMAGVSRKIKEWAKAMKIEKMLSKQQILELYLNVIFVGDKNYGVEVGAQYYFNKSAKDLSLAQCAFMAGINNRPNYYNPYDSKKQYGKDQTKTDEINNRTKTVLKKMLETGAINQEEYDKAYKEVEKGFKFKQGHKNSMIYSYHTDATIAQVIKDLMEQKGWSQDYASTYVYGGGLKIYSTQNTKVQEKIEKVQYENAGKVAKMFFEANGEYQDIIAKIMQEDFSKYHDSPSGLQELLDEYKKGKYTQEEFVKMISEQKEDRTKKDKGATSQSAMVVIDNETGYAVGVVGGLGEKTESRGLNRATQSKRQTGSSMKPIADLAPGINEGLINPSTMYEDYKTEFENGKYTPKDYDGFDGRAVSIREATMRSKNIPFVKVMAEVTPTVSRNYLQKMGVTSLTERDLGLSMAIGGLDEGISPLEMAGAYSTISNDGVYRTPLLYTKIVDNSGNIVLEPKQENTEVFSKQTAYIIKDLLVSVVKGSRGTASYCAISGIDVAAKTGTTNSNNDKWLCGFTNYYTAATWYGYDKKEEVTGAANPAGKIWAAVMKSLHTDKKKSRFSEPDGIVTMSVCDKTGLKATGKCSSTHKEIFVKGHEPDSCDESGSSVEICEETGDIATEYCPEIVTQYYSYTLPKERLGLWKTLKSNSKAPTQVCTEHDKETAKKNADAPTISIIGGTTVTLNVGESYTEKGAKANDKKDGDLTGKITISGSVNTSKAGTYTVKYTVKNSSDKTTTATRTVIVKSKETPKPTTPTEPSKPTEDDKNSTGSSDKENTSGGSTEKPSTDNKTNETE